MKIVKNFQPKIFIFTAVKNRCTCMLHRRRVFVMLYSDNITLATLFCTIFVYIKTTVTVV